VSELDRWSGAEWRHFAALRAVAEHGTFGKAAAKLGYTQSAISQQIATLERTLGSQLIERPTGARKASLTAAGTLLLDHIEAVMARLSVARADLRALEEDQAASLRVGICQSLGTRLPTEAVRRLGKRADRALVDLVRCDCDRYLLEMLKEGNLDVAFTACPVEPPFEGEELVRDRYVLLAAAGSPLARSGQSPTLAEVGAMSVIGLRGSAGERLERTLRAQDIELQVSVRTDHEATLGAIVAAGLGVALVPQLSVDADAKDVVALELADDAPVRAVGVAWHRDRPLSALGAMWVEICREICGPATRENLLVAV
jgi:DNA-binding transcriptional LysR family regulator